RDARDRGTALSLPPPGGRGTCREEFDDLRRHLLPRILLHEMPRVLDPPHLLPPQLLHHLEEPRPRPPEDRVLPPEPQQRGLLPAPEDLARGAVSRGEGIVGRERDEPREGPRPGLVATVREGRVVRADHLRR